MSNATLALAGNCSQQFIHFNHTTKYAEVLGQSLVIFAPE